MKHYILVTTVEERETVSRPYWSEQVLEKGMFVAIPNYQDQPITAKVHTVISEYEALTKYSNSEEIIDIIDCSKFNKKKEAVLRQQILSDKMREKISVIKDLEVLEKYAGKDPSMLELLNEFKNLNAIETVQQTVE